MKHLIILLLLFATAVQGEEYGFVTKYIDMPLDHFSFTTNTTFKLRYLVNDSYFSNDQPIFFYTGNEGDISMFAQNTGFLFELAEKMGALIIFAEHRKIASTDIGKQNISKTFDLCTSLKSDDDLNTFLNWLSEMYTMIVEVNYPYPNSFLVPLPGNPVREFCSRMDSVNYNNDDGLIKALSTGVQLFTNYTGTTKCNNIGQTASPSLGELGWDFQACTDMIMPMCSTDEDLFENAAWNFTEYSDDCYKQFGVRPRNEEVPILEFGGTEIETASNIVFSNGLLDPWSSGGVIANVSAQVWSILMPNGAHHSDLRSANELDADDVKSARLFHEKHIQKWLDKFYFRNLPLDIYTARLKSKYI
ncbi:hypothetical protein YQE_03319, partial [Dendroctonus ponderosae]